MNARKLVIIAAVVVFLAALAAVKKNVRDRQAAQEDQAPPVEEVTLVSDLPANLVTRIEVYKGAKPEEKLVLSKEGEAWTVASKFGVKARPDEVDRIFREMKVLKGELRVDSSVVFPDFKIGDDEGLHIIMSAGAEKPLLHLVVGLRRVGWNKNFMRLEGEQRIVLVSKDLLRLLRVFGDEGKVDTAYAADYKMFSFDPSQVVKVTIRPAAAKEPLVLRKDPAAAPPQSSWAFDPPLQSRREELDPDKAQALVQAVADMAGQDAVDPGLAQDHGLRPASTEVILEDAQGQTVAQLNIGSRLESEKVNYVEARPSGLCFKVASDTVDKVKGDRASFLRLKQQNKK